MAPDSGEVCVDVVPALSDNYMYLISDPTTRVAAVIDPVEPEKLLQKAAERNVQICCVLTTHSHWDHAGGNAKLASFMKKQGLPLEIYGGRGDGVEACTREVEGGDEICIGSNLKCRVLWTPCHTPGHVSYYFDNNMQGGTDKNSTIIKTPMVFTGDTLFVGGCGNFNSGTPEQMYRAMCEVLAKLPSDTLVYCGHEYTHRNLKFAICAEPDNEKIKMKLSWAAKCQCTVPSTIGEELETNPFIRVNHPAIQKYTGEVDPVKGMYAVRKLKDQWGRLN